MRREINPDSLFGSVLPKDYWSISLGSTAVLSRKYWANHTGWCFHIKKLILYIEAEGIGGLLCLHLYI